MLINTAHPDRDAKPPEPSRDPKVSYDPEADAVFVRLGSGGSSETIAATENVNLDFDSHGRLLALEILDASNITPELVKAARLKTVAAE